MKYKMRLKGHSISAAFTAVSCAAPSMDPPPVQGDKPCILSQRGCV